MVGAAMTDTKMTKLVGEHWVCSVMAGHGWGVALTRDGLERADVLGVHSESRRVVEVQVKTASFMSKPNWRVNQKAQQPAKTTHEWFVLVALAESPSSAPRGFVVPRDHIAAAAWIMHTHWLTEPGIARGKRNASVDQARVPLPVFAEYEDRWGLLLGSTEDVPVMLPDEFRARALEPRVGLPPDHPWTVKPPVWASTLELSPSERTKFANQIVQRVP
jgi:hypothetical protein